MANILTAAEAANVLRTEDTDAVMLDLLPLIDQYIQGATGRDWAADTQVYPQAKSAARMLLVMWYENPAMINQSSALSFGLSAALTQLEALGLRFKNFEGLSGAGAICLPGVKRGDTVTAVTGIIGISGDQAAAFETVITWDGQIQQVSTSNLYGKWFRALITPVEGV